MYGANPNQRNNPFKPFDFGNSRLFMGGINPFGFGQERIDGALALQRNVSGLPTNTVPLPQSGMGFDPRARTQHNLQAMRAYQYTPRPADMSGSLGFLPEEWHRRAQTNAATPGAFLQLAKAGLTRADGQYLQNGQPIMQDEWYRQYRAAIQAGHQPPQQVANGVRTGAVADAYAARAGQPAAATPRRSGMLGEY